MSSEGGGKDDRLTIQTQLHTVHVENFGVIRQARLEFGPGLNVITGESGSGKSLVLTAIDAALGHRVSTDQVGPFGDRARVGLTMMVPPSEPIWRDLERLGLEPDTVLVISREWGRDGRSVLRVQGQPTPLSAVREALAALVDLAGQHEHQRLKTAGHALGWLNRLVDAELLAQCRGAWAHIKELQSQRQEWQDRLGQPDTRDRTREDLEQLTSLNLMPGEDEELQRHAERLGHGQQLLEWYHAVLEILESGPGETVSSQLNLARRLLEHASQRDEAARDLLGLLDQAETIMEEIRHRVYRLVESIDLDPARLTAVRERLDQVARAKRRYGTDLDGLIALIRRLTEELKAHEDVAWELKATERRLAEATEQYQTAAHALSTARQQRAIEASTAITDIVRQLDMPSALVRLAVHPAESGPEGIDQIEWQFMANPGQELKPLSRVASGGELARVALALWAFQREAGVLMFDEVDTGLGGQAARRVVALLTQLARTQQVIVVSHQPLVAAAAAMHWLVGKHQNGRGAETRVKRLAEQERIQEIARMLSGSDDHVALQHARRLLAGAG